MRSFVYKQMNSVQAVALACAGVPIRYSFTRY